MSADDMNDPEIRAAIAASLSDDFGGVHPSNDPNERQEGVIDLTGDTDRDDDDVVPTYPKSNSVIGIETDEDETDSGDDSSNDDEDLKKAIALSMQESGNGDEDSHGKEASPKNPQPIHNENTQNPGPFSSDGGRPSPKDQELPKPMGIFGLDRKQMELDRLARIAKRNPEDSMSIEEPEAKYQKTVLYPQSNDRKTLDILPKTIGSSARSSTTLGETTKEQRSSCPSTKPFPQFPLGVIKKTWAFGSPRQDNDAIKLEEVFQRSDLELAVLSSFMWDTEWLFSKLDTKRTRIMMVMQAKEESTKRQFESETAHMSNLRLCFPPMDPQVNCMHSKLMLLFHPGYLRIVVPTANLTPFDWGEEGGVMENSVFLIDLPKVTGQPSEGEKTPFLEELMYFLRASTLHDNIIAKLDSFDFSKTSHIAFVHTIGGSHTGESWKRTGYCGLGRAVKALGLQISTPVNIDFVTSSLGSLTDEFLRSLYLASQGDDGSTEYVLRTAKSFPAKSLTDPTTLIPKTTAEEWKNRFRVYFPSGETVRASRGGPGCAGTICFQSKWYAGPKFPRHVLRDCKSTRPGLLMHNKILYVRPDEPISLPDDSQCPAWAYVGSANLSESAWGRLVQDRATKQPKLNCRNWECGVLIPIIDKKQSKDAEGPLNHKDNAAESVNMLNDFQNTVPVPMRLPGSRYGPDHKPWYYAEMDR